MNDEQKLEKILEAIKQEGKKKTLLLHCCCAPCSSACIERLLPFFEITLYFYNPNIEEEEEYFKRKEELCRFAKLKGVNVQDVDHEVKEFVRISKGHEKDKERGARCYLCYELRLSKTAFEARKGHFDYFGTTLSISPFKNATWLNEIGSLLEREVNVSYLYADFKKKDGYKRSIVLAKEYGLYRQDYCGCHYSKEEREKKKNGTIYTTKNCE